MITHFRPHQQGPAISFRQLVMEPLAARPPNLQIAFQRRARRGRMPHRLQIGNRPPLAAIFAQNDRREKRVPTTVMQRLVEKLEPPTATEGYSLVLVQ